MQKLEKTLPNIATTSRKMKQLLKDYDYAKNKNDEKSFKKCYQKIKNLWIDAQHNYTNAGEELNKAIREIENILYEDTAYYTISEPSESDTLP